MDDACPFLFSSEYLDSETNLVYYNYRYYSTDLGRWISRDSIGENGGINLYAMVGNDPVGMWDLLGLNLYAVDGTWSDADDHFNTKRFYDRVKETKYYWEGPNCGVTGLDASSIFRGVKAHICRDFCNDHSITINLVGWSRGGVIVMEVAEELQDDGCCCSDGKIYYPNVNWMGLFDAVDMTVTWGWANNITSNVKNASHVKKSKTQLLFPTVSGKAEDPTKTKVTTVVLKNSTHGDVGGKKSAKSDAALSWMIDQAKMAGVDMKGMDKRYKYVK
jgi:RHS repeat-associated protein